MAPDPSKKFKQLVRTAEQLFFKHGVKKVSVEEICERAGISKMTFYKHFDNKENLVRHIRDELMRTGFAKYDEINAMDIPFPEKIDRITEWRVAFFSRIQSEFIEDILSFEETMAEMKKRFIQNIITAQNRGEVRKDISPGLIWLVAERLNQIAVDGSWKSVFSDYNELHRQLRTMYFFGLLTRVDSSNQ